MLPSRYFPHAGKTGRPKSMESRLRRIATLRMACHSFALYLLRLRYAPNTPRAYSGLATRRNALYQHKPQRGGHLSPPPSARFSFSLRIISHNERKSGADPMGRGRTSTPLTPPLSRTVCPTRRTLFDIKNSDPLAHTLWASEMCEPGFLTMASWPISRTSDDGQREAPVGVPDTRHILSSPASLRFPSAACADLINTSQRPDDFWSLLLYAELDTKTREQEAMRHDFPDGRQERAP